MTIKFKLYYDLMSQPSRAIYILLNVSKIPFESVPVALRKGEHLSDEYAAINRFRKVPCIVDGDFKLAESIAILRYLDTKYPMSELYPKEPQQRARIDEFLEWQHLGLRLNLSNHFRLRFIQPILHSKPVDERELAQATKLRDSSLKYFEKNWLDQSKFIIGDSPTIADLFAACEIEQTRYDGFEPGAGRPTLGAWLESVKQKLDPLYSDVHKYIWMFGKKSKL